MTDLDQNQIPASSLDTDSPALSPEPTPAIPVPPDLNVPWGWWDIVLFLLFYVGSLLLFTRGGLIAGAAALHISIEELLKRSVVVVTIAILATGAASLSTLAYFWVIVRLRRSRGLVNSGEGFWRVMGWRPFAASVPGASLSSTVKIGLHIVAGVALAFAVSQASGYIGQPGPVPFEEFFKTRPTVLMMMVFGILVAPLVEEMMFRGFLYPVVARKFGMGTGIIVTGVLFGATHAPQLSGAWGQIALIVAVGLLFTWARARSKTVLSSFLLHIAYNSTLFAGLLIESHWLRDL
jgi:membrane protease YdiL (CAAX protease family)